MQTKRLTRIALMAAVISVLAPLSIPLAGEVPISLATFAVMLAGCALGAIDGAIAAGIYLILGAIGVPVFAGYASGFGILFGVTGGFLFGYIPLAFCSGLIYRKLAMNVKGTMKFVWMTIAMLVGNVILYALGIVWFMTVTGYPIATAMAACVIPFIPGDLLKIVLVNAIIPGLVKVIR